MSTHLPIQQQPASQPPAGTPSTEPISVLVADDSAFMRKMISEMVASEPSFRLIGTARDGEDAVEQIERLNPRVVTLDIEMPRLDGFGVLTALAGRPAESPPISVVVLSSITQHGAEATLRCLDMGAVDFVAKPSGSISLDIASVRDDLLTKIKAAGHSSSVAILAQKHKRFSLSRLEIADRPADAPPQREASLQTASQAATSRQPKNVLVIGASTGGPHALQTLISNLDIPRLGMPIVIVQHMPPRFTASLAAHLEHVAGPGLRIVEAKAGDRLEPGVALLAPGGKHLVFSPDGTARLSDEPPIHGVRPAVDVTMMSLAAIYKCGTFGVLLTGMGRDGARAMKLIRDLGGHTLAEHESSCVVYGMPKAAVELGGVEQVVALPEMASAILRMVQANSKKGLAA